jgi:protein-tyrosine phosphatase
LTHQNDSNQDLNFAVRDDLLGLTPTHIRVLPFQGFANFRDLGGYPTVEGRKVKWNVLYRSGQLDKGTREDLEVLSGLGIHTLVDFRSEQEREKTPDLLPRGHSIQLIHLPIQEEGQPPLAPEIRRLIKERKLKGQDPSRKMRKMYYQLGANFYDAYRQFFQALLDAKGKPVLWHCSAGKDRAGFAAALTLRLLGVDDKIVTQDYLLSREHTHFSRRQILTVGLLRGPRAARFISRLNDVDQIWLQTAFQSLDQTWGDFNQYVKEGLGLSFSDINQLRAYYLE